MFNNEYGMNLGCTGPYLLNRLLYNWNRNLNK